MKKHPTTTPYCGTAIGHKKHLIKIEHPCDRCVHALADFNAKKAVNPRYVETLSPKLWARNEALMRRESTPEWMLEAEKAFALQKQPKLPEVVKVSANTCRNGHPRTEANQRERRSPTGNLWRECLVCRDTSAFRKKERIHLEIGDD